MNKNLSEISGYFHVEKLRNDKRIVVFTICLLIATVLWFLNALSKDYSTVVSYPVKFVNPPENLFVSNELPEKLEIDVEAHGFILLRHKLSLSFSPLILNISEITKNIATNSGVYTIQTSGLLSRIANQMGSEMTVNGVQPDFITIKLDSLITKSVLVSPSVQLSFSPQYKLKGNIRVIPERVSITGPASLLEAMQSLPTTKETIEQLNSDTERLVLVEHPVNTEINPEKVTLRIPVEKSTEKDLKIPVQVKNKPEGTKIKLFPSEIKITMLVGLSEFGNITPSQFSAVVDFLEIKSETTSLEIKIEEKPANIELLRISPETVEFLIEND